MIFFMGIARQFLLVCVIATVFCTKVPYYGARIGKFSTHFHEVRGEVYAVDDKTLFIKGFNFDGKATDAYFWAGATIRPDTTGFIIPDEKSSIEPLKQYDNQDLVLRLPEDKNVKDIRWLSIWSKKYNANFGSLIFPRTLEPPRPVIIGSLQDTKKGVSSGEILILDTQTFLIPDFNYDGKGNDVYWWLSRGMKSNIGGLRLLDENGSDEPLKEYKNKIVVISLPDGHSVFDYNILSLWSTSEITDYGSVEIPSELNVPPSPRTLGVQTEIKVNCEMLNDNLGFEVRWLIQGEEIIIQLVGKINSSEYMALGLSKDDTETKFNAADVFITWLDLNGQGHAMDYFLDNTEQCENGHGICPDEIHGGSDNLVLLNWVKIGSTNEIIFKRPLLAGDKKYDQNIYTDGPQAILWAVGPLLENNLPGVPKLITKGNLLLDFGREPIWNCPPPTEKAQPNNSPQKIHCPSDHKFRAQIGPSTRENVEKVWYINGMQAPELVVQRGKTYTFIIEGGMTPPTHHPFYITSNNRGGFKQTLLEEGKINEEIYAGIKKDLLTGSYLPIAEGRLCEWSYSKNDPYYSVMTFFSKISPILTLNCEEGNPGELIWTPGNTTKDTVYYQSFREKYMGGKIHVVDFCEENKPILYLESEVFKSNKHIGNNANKPDLEREDDFVIFKDESINNEDHTAAELIENLPFLPTSGENFSSSGLSIDRINSLKTLNGIDKLYDDYKNKINFTIFNATKFQIDEPINNQSKITFYRDLERLLEDSLNPHDASERSDKNLSEAFFSETKGILQQDKIQVGSLHYKEQNPEQIIYAKADDVQDVSTKITQPPLEFKPQFEGGFVPLVLNPMKESTLSKEYVLPPPHMRRIPKPFLFNESIPFHETFKPGIPDFSGFNISNYSQEDTSYPVNHVPDHISLVSAPKPQIIENPLLSTGGLPQELFKIPQRRLPRPQIYGYGPRNQFNNVNTQHQPLLTQLHNKKLSNYPDTNIKDELDEVSSQRMQIALQKAEDKSKHDILSRKKQPPYQSNKMIHPLHPPPIQRRPDFIGEDSIKLNQPKTIHLKQSPQNMNKNVEKILPLQDTRLHRPLNFQRPVIGVRAHINRGFLGNRFQGNPSQVSQSQINLKQTIIRGRPQNLGSFQKMVSLHIPSKIELNVPKEIIVTPENKPDFNEFNEKGISNGDIIKRPNIMPEKESIISKNTASRPMIINPDQIDTQTPHARPHLLLLRHPTNLKLRDAQVHAIPELFNLKTNREINQNIPLSNPGIQSYSLNQMISVMQNPQTILHLKNLPFNRDTYSNENKNIVKNHKPLLLNENSSPKPNIQKILPSALPNNQKSTESPIFSSQAENEPNSEMLASANEFALTNDFDMDYFSTYSPESESKYTEQRNEELNIKPEYGNDDLDNTESTDYDVPFGARLKFPYRGQVTGGKPPYLPENRPNIFIHRRRPQFSSIPDKEISFTIATTLPSIETEASISESPVLYSDMKSTKDQTSINSNAKDLPSLSSEHQTIKTVIQNNSLSITESTTLTPITHSINIKDKSSHSNLDSSLSNYHERKNLQSSEKRTTSNNQERIQENINLPHIMTKPPIHDNGTDYSILNHVLALIGGPPHQKHVALPRKSEP